MSDQFKQILYNIIATIRMLAVLGLYRLSHHIPDLDISLSQKIYTPSGPSQKHYLDGDDNLFI